MPLSVSVVTPSYNQGRFLDRTIRSVLSQKIPGRMEYFVMDGGSTDESVEVIQRYSASLEWLSERDRGQADAVNKGLARATGDVIGWLNSDDIYYPNAIQTACDYLERHPDVDAVYGEGNHIDEDDRIIEPYPLEDWDSARLKDYCFLCQPAVFFRRRLVERFGPLNVDLRYTLDYEYWLRLADGGARFARIGGVLAGSRLHADTKTLGSRVPVHRETNDMLRARYGQVPERWLFNYAHAVVDAKGIPRTRRLAFAIRVSAISLYAAMHWNRRISGRMWKTVAQWVGGALRA